MLLPLYFCKTEEWRVRKVLELAVKFGKCCQLIKMVIEYYKRKNNSKAITTFKIII